MRVETVRYSPRLGFQAVSKPLKVSPQLILAFGNRYLLEKQTVFDDVRKRYPTGRLVVCSSAGEILGDTVSEGELVIAAIAFEHTNIVAVSDVVEPGKSLDVGRRLADQLPDKDLVHCLVFSDGIMVNGTELVQGLAESLPAPVSVTGGLVGDDARFEKTVLGLDERPASGKIILIGLYSKRLKISYGSLGGWDNFGPIRTVTKAQGNVLYEIDGQPVLELYKKYLGPKAKDLPSAGLLFPLSLEIDGEQIVRTILSVDESEQSMTFAGSIPEGVKARLMKANFERLIDGAAGAASASVTKMKKNQAELALLISCIGRKLVLGTRVEEEIDAVGDVLGEHVPLFGFYSYGEICPTAPTEKQCRVHNQTMTITTFKEE